MAFARFAEETAWDIWVLDVNAAQSDRPLLATPNSELMPAFSPDGRWMAYVSDETGRMEVFVRSLDSAAGKWQISSGGGSEPVWAPSGRELCYRYGEVLMAVEVAPAPEFAASKPRRLLTGLGEAIQQAWTPNYDVSPDGERFLFLRPSQEAKPVTHIDVVLGWSADLKGRVK